MAEVRHLCGFLPYLFGVFFVVFIYLSMWLVVIIRGDNFWFYIGVLLKVAHVRAVF